ncbi:hypothetical protein TorRG33x02_032640 [Trema orientale]|uniref:Uncharacterized protein n=1 Tax=Trema orientale TaxID=63057 RepID=A0A2P5FTG7_TREOI|nr:hypothetical protein TorRG33x02_032640 [Trema orientale]
MAPVVQCTGKQFIYRLLCISESRQRATNTTLMKGAPSNEENQVNLSSIEVLFQGVRSGSVNNQESESEGPRPKFVNDQGSESEVFLYFYLLESEYTNIFIFI